MTVPRVKHIPKQTLPGHLIQVMIPDLTVAPTSREQWFGALPAWWLPKPCRGCFGGGQRPHLAHLHSLGTGSREDWRAAGVESRGYTGRATGPCPEVSLNARRSLCSGAWDKRNPGVQLCTNTLRTNPEAPKLKYLLVCEVGFILLLLWCQIQDLLL